MRRFLLILFFLAVALAYAGSRIRVVELGYKVSKLKTEVEGLRRKNGVLKSEVAKALATVNLSGWSGKLGLASPRADQIFMLRQAQQERD